MITIPIKLQQKLADSKQEHVLNFWEELNDSDRGFLVSQLESIDFDMFATMQQKTVNKQVKNITPCETVLLDDKYHNDGVASIKKGEIGVLTVAGGQGTRLGWSGPKGTFPATPVSGKSLFQVIAEQIVCS